VADAAVDRCPAESRSKPHAWAFSPRTARAQPEAGHEGLHRWVEPGTEGRHEKLWAGPAQRAPDNTRFRFGLRPS